MNAEIKEFLLESNAIEGVYDLPSLKQAFRAWKYCMEQKSMTPDVVEKVHSILMLGHLKGKERGHYRKVPVYVGREEMLNEKYIPSSISNWCMDMNDNCGPDEEHAKWLHVKYEGIHPFIDGNGRTGRIFMNWHRLRNGLPLLTIHEGAEQTEYYGWFK